MPIDPTRRSDRRTLLGATAAAGVTAAGLALTAGRAAAGPAGPSGTDPGATGPAAKSSSAPGASAAEGGDGRWHGAPGTSGVTLRWFGNHAWEIGFGPTTILIDPWLTRFPTGTYHGGTRPDTPLRVDKPLIDRHISRADLILVSHGHFDHITDVPHIATRTHATVLGTESHHNMLRALGAPDDQLSTVRGGEYLQFDGFTVQVFRSLHSLIGARRQMPFPGTRPGPGPLPVPQTVKDLVEGETLVYQITVGERFRIVAISTANFIQDELACLRPDLALLPGGGATLHDYLPRLLRTLDNPPYILPTHWDDIDVELEKPAVDPGPFLPGFRDAVATLSPRSKFVVLDHLQTFTP